MKKRNGIISIYIKKENIIDSMPFNIDNGSYRVITIIALTKNGDFYFTDKLVGQDKFNKVMKNENDDLDFGFSAFSYMKDLEFHVLTVSEYKKLKEMTNEERRVYYIGMEG